MPVVAATDEPDVPGPRRIGRYVPLRRLGAGGMGVVYLAYDPKLDRQVAVKLVRTRGRGFPVGARARLAREARALAKLSHPNVTHVFDVGESDDGLFIAMEFIEGVTLRQWLATRPRTWREVLDVFTQAGKGLAAAHRMGIVHRDFKPDNVIVGDGGRVRVLDFGLAVLHEEEPASQESIDLDDEETLRMRLTVTGVVMGTPAYMAPEQHCGQLPDARTDQFSFCVALYEGLFGARPFVGATSRELAAATHGGPPAPPDVGVPKALRRAVLRGLAPDPAHRWRSLDALLRAAKGRRLLRPRLLAAGLVATAALGGVFALGSADTARDPCLDAAREVGRTWDSRRQEVRDAMLGSGYGYADDSWKRIDRALDAYADEWHALRASSCVGEKEPLLDARIACLDRAAMAFDATVDVLADEETPVVEHAMQTAASLPVITNCEDPELLRSPLTPPAPSLALEVGRARQRVAQAQALEAAGQYPAGLELARAAVSAARRTGYKPVIAEALAIQGKLAMRVSDYDDAALALEQAVAIGVEVRHDEVALDGMMLLAGMLGYSQARTAEGMHWYRSAEALARRGIDRRKRVTLINLRAGMLFRQERIDAALRTWESGLEIIADPQSLPERHLAIATRNNLGSMHALKGQWAHAEAHLRAAHDAARSMHGPHHPVVATAAANLANVLREAGKYDAALVIQREAYEDWVRALGPDHPLVAAAQANLGMMARSAGKFDEALAHLEAAADVKRRTLGPHHPDLALSLNNYGDVLRDAGRSEEALAAHIESLEIWRASASSDDRLAYALINIGYDLIDLGRPDEAISPLAEALDITQRWQLTETGYAEAAFGLAQALGDRDPERSRRLAQDAQRIFDRIGGRYLEQRDEVELWLRSR